MFNVNFNDIFTAYEKPIYNYVLRMVKNQPVAQDLTQEVFIKVYHNLEQYRGDAKLSTWIYQIATNTCLDYFRTAAYKKETKTEILNDTASKELPENEIEKVLSMEEKLIKSEMSSCVQEFVDDLPEDYRATIVLHDLRGFKNREIAAILNCSLETVKIRLHRARKKLRSVLASNCEFYRDSENELCCDKKEYKSE